MCSRLCRALRWGWAGQGPREITGTPLVPHQNPLEPTGTHGSAPADLLVPSLHPKVPERSLAPATPRAPGQRLGSHTQAGTCPLLRGFLLSCYNYFGQVAFHLHLLQLQVIFLNTQKKEISSLL